MTLPIEPTERDRERFRDMAKAIGLHLIAFPLPFRFENFQTNPKGCAVFFIGLRIVRCYLLRAVRREHAVQF